MDTGLNLRAYNIVEPWSDDDNDIAHHLHDILGVNYTMRGVSGHAEDNDVDTIIYTVYITDEDAVHIKLVYPNVSVRPCVIKEQVSTLAKRICENSIG